MLFIASFQTAYKWVTTTEFFINVWSPCTSPIFTEFCQLSRINVDIDSDLSETWRIWPFSDMTFWIQALNPQGREAFIHIISVGQAPAYRRLNAITQLWHGLEAWISTGHTTSIYEMKNFIKLSLTISKSVSCSYNLLIHGIIRLTKWRPPWETSYLVGNPHKLQAFTMPASDNLPVSVSLPVSANISQTQNQKNKLGWMTMSLKLYCFLFTHLSTNISPNPCHISQH